MEATPDIEMIESMGPKARKAAAPTTKLTLNMFRKKGYICSIAEHWNAFAGVRNDLYGFVDICAVNEETPELLLIQTTSWGNVPARRKKIQAIKAAAWLSRVPGVRILIQGWKKQGTRWVCRQEEFKA